MPAVSLRLAVVWWLLYYEFETIIGIPNKSVGRIKHTALCKEISDFFAMEFWYYCCTTVPSFKESVLKRHLYNPKILNSLKLKKFESKTLSLRP